MTKAQTRTVIVWKLATLDADGSVVARSDEYVLKVVEPGEEVPRLVPLTGDQCDVVLEALTREQSPALAKSADPGERLVAALEGIAAKPPVIVNVPAQVAPTVNVLMPERRPMLTRVNRSPDGLIESVTEEPMTEAE